MVDKEVLLETFQSTNSSSERQAIMHYATVHARDLAMIKNVRNSHFSSQRSYVKKC